MTIRTTYVQKIRSDHQNIGGKAEGIKQLQRFGLRIPSSYVLDYSSFRDFINDELNIRQLKRELTKIIDPECIYIVRSSANIEDGAESSYAGQFLSIPNIQGVDQLIQAIKQIWESIDSEKISAYKLHNMKSPCDIAVLLQKMVTPIDLSGAVFTRNPVNGKQEILIEAVKGPSKLFLQDGLTPHRWVFRENCFTETPTEEVIPNKILKRIIDKSNYLERKLDYPLDLEWVLSENKIWWVQLRKITSLETHNIYSNTISREQLPGLIKPLVWSVNVPLVCGAWIRLLNELVGSLDLTPNDLVKQFHYRAYYNMGKLGTVFEKIGFPKDGLESMMGHNTRSANKPKIPMQMIPRLLWFILGKSMLIQNLKNNMNLSFEPIEDLRTDATLQEQLSYIDQLFEYNQESAYDVILSQLIHSIFYKIASNRLRNKGYLPDEIQLEVDIEEYDINKGLYELGKLIVETNIPDIVECLHCNEGIPEPVSSFFNRFGHYRENGNDFSMPSWSEIPEIILPLAIQTQNKKKKNRIKPNDWFSRNTLMLHEIRERVSQKYLKSYGLFRPVFLDMSGILVDRGILEDLNDIWYLRMDEVRDICNGYHIDSIKLIINERREEMKNAAMITLPDIIYGENAPIVHNKQIIIKQLNGIPAASGYYTGKIRHVKGLNDFNQVKKGEILVIPFSDVSWTPIFSKAGAIISESGGLLSHAAVIAREYKIPAILGVTDGYQIREGSEVLVDGYTGLIKILK